VFRAEKYAKKHTFLFKSAKLFDVRIHPTYLQRKRDEFFLKGMSIADWARLHQFRQDLVYAVLSGRSKCTRGESHRIAVRLGLKPEAPTTSSHLEEENV
jgi:gp16 family phage-associated protein